MKALPIGIILFAFAGRAVAQLAVVDAPALANNQLAHAENVAKWVESINTLRTQIDQLRQQIDIQNDVRKWTGNPVEAGGSLVLEGLGQTELVRDYGRAKDAVVGLVDSLQSLGNTARGNYRVISDVDLDGGVFERDPMIYRRYGILDAKWDNSEQVADETEVRTRELQEEIALTLADLKAAPTDAEVQKQAAKLAALNGQLEQVEAARRRRVDEVTLQKIANDSRIEEERLAAAELEARNDFLANQRVSEFLKTLKVRINPYENR